MLKQNNNGIIYIIIRVRKFDPIGMVWMGSVGRMKMNENLIS